MRQNPDQQGLYRPQFEHDNCGIGAVVDMKGRKSRNTVEQALRIVENLEHRAGKDAEGKTVKAFARGLHAALTPGAALTQVKLSVKKQGTVVFYFLESYELADGRRAA